MPGPGRQRSKRGNTDGTHILPRSSLAEHLACGGGSRRQQTSCVLAIRRRPRLHHPPWPHGLPLGRHRAARRHRLGLQARLTHFLLKAIEDGRIASLDDPVVAVEPRLAEINAAPRPQGPPHHLATHGQPDLLLRRHRRARHRVRLQRLADRAALGLPLPEGLRGSPRNCGRCRASSTADGRPAVRGPADDVGLRPARPAGPHGDQPPRLRPLRAALPARRQLERPATDLPRARPHGRCHPPALRPAADGWHRRRDDPRPADHGLQPHPRQPDRPLRQLQLALVGQRRSTPPACA